VPFSRDSMIRMFHCLVIDLKIPLFSMPFMQSWHCLTAQEAYSPCDGMENSLFPKQWQHFVMLSVLILMCHTLKHLSDKAKKHLFDMKCTTFRNWGKRHLYVAIIPLKIAFLKCVDRCLSHCYRMLSGTVYKHSLNIWLVFFLIEPYASPINQGCK
jgi:hypothetical protein